MSDGEQGWGATVNSYHVLSAGSIANSSCSWSANVNTGVRLTRVLALALPPVPSEARVALKGLPASDCSGLVQPNGHVLLVPFSMLETWAVQYHLPSTPM